MEIPRRRTRALPDWVAWAGATVFAVLIVDAFARTLAEQGFFAAGGVFGIIVFLAFLAWVLVTSLLLTQRVAGARRSSGGRRRRPRSAERYAGTRLRTSS